MKNVYAWAVDAAPGSVLVYHTGERLRDERLKTYGSQFSKAQDEEAAAFGYAWKAHTQGLVFLAQRRIRAGQRKGELQYLAIKLSAVAAAALGLLPNAKPSLNYRRAA